MCSTRRKESNDEHSAYLAYIFDNLVLRYFYFLLKSQSPICLGSQKQNYLKVQSRPVLINLTCTIHQSNLAIAVTTKFTLSHYMFLIVLLSCFGHSFRPDTRSYHDNHDNDFRSNTHGVFCCLAFFETSRRAESKDERVQGSNAEEWESAEDSVNQLFYQGQSEFDVKGQEY